MYNIERGQTQLWLIVALGTVFPTSPNNIPVETIIYDKKQTSVKKENNISISRKYEKK